MPTHRHLSPMSTLHKHHWRQRHQLIFSEEYATSDALDKVGETGDRYEERENTYTNCDPFIRVKEATILICSDEVANVACASSTHDGKDEDAPPRVPFVVGHGTSCLRW
eukprot:GHVT01063836.1.p3 GENE.GHVT01063836.1~~GHVT01063836.1.p3  ORF type:complete len:109 (-),score=11.86 GHVT01063836.1:607-933(-)